VAVIKSRTYKMVRRDINWGWFSLLPIESSTYNFQIHSIHSIHSIFHITLPDRFSLLFLKNKEILWIPWLITIQPL
jgi:hypothetical protein